MTSMGKKPKVANASVVVTTSGVINCNMIISQTYAKIDKEPVTAKTASPSIFRISGEGIATTHTAVITSRLKAALPTIVEGPNSPAKNLFETHSMTDSRISGADDPRAIRVRLATVS